MNRTTHTLHTNEIIPHTNNSIGRNIIKNISELIKFIKKAA